MSAPSTREQFKDYCLRRLGYPVIEINVADEQVEDRIDDALQLFQDYHFNGVERLFMKHKITQQDIDRRWIHIPEAIIGVVSIYPFDNSNASVNMFDLRYQLRLHDLYDFTSVSYVPYTITMQHIRTLNLLFSGTPAIRFNRHINKLYIDVDWERDIQIGEYLVIDCYRKLEPDTFIGTGFAQTISGNNQVSGSGTLFTKEFVISDEVTISSETKRIVSINSDTSMIVDSAYNYTVTAQPTKIGLSDVWDDRFLKRYATALIKKQWGENLKKFGGVQMPGGVTLNGQQIWQEAVEEIQKIEDDMQVYNVLPNEILVG